MYFKEYVKALRKGKNLTQAQLAEILGISLDAIKKIESGQTQYPSSKVLKSLSEFEGISEEHILSMILFGIVEPQNNDPRVFKVALCSNSYLARLFINGWNIKNYFHVLEVHDLGKQQFIAELTKKRDSNYTLLIDHADKYQNLRDLLYSGLDVQINIFIYLFTIYVSLDKRYNAVQILCDATDQFQTDLFRYMESFTTDRVRLPITFILYNGLSCELIAEHKVNS